MKKMKGQKRNYVNSINYYNNSNANTSSSKCSNSN